MACLIIVGTQWGDEGKGKVVDLLTERADAVSYTHLTLPTTPYV